MATRKQKAQQRNRARQHSRRDKPALPATFSSDDQWLLWSRDHGLDVTNRDQLLDSAAVGLTVLCWRNTALEDVHAGVERSSRLEALGLELDNPEVEKQEEAAQRAHYEQVDADWDQLAVVDPDEYRRIGRWLDGREEGFGIPDDIMMRLNISTALAVREALDAELPATVTAAGAELRYDRRAAPDHVVAVAELLRDPFRVMRVGGTEVTAGDVLGASWDEYSDDVMRKVGSHLAFCDSIGARRGLWYMGLSGILYASGWYPNPWWSRAVDRLRQAAADGDTAALYYTPEAAPQTLELDNELWRLLLEAPAELSGPQCNWLQYTRIRDMIRAVREEDRTILGPLEGQQRFSSLATLF